MNSADFFDQKAIRKEQTQDEQHRRIDEKLRASKSHWWSRRDYSQLTAEERDLIKNRDQYSSRRDAWHFGVIQAGNARYTVKEDRQKTRTERQETKRRIETKKLNQAIDNMPDAEKERYLEYWSTRDPEAMKEYQAFMAKKNKNSGNAAAAASENAVGTAMENAGVENASAEAETETAKETAEAEKVAPASQEDQVEAAVKTESQLPSALVDGNTMSTYDALKAELKTEKVDDALDNIEANRINHILDGSRGSDHAWHLITPNGTWNEVKPIIKTVLKEGTAEKYGNVDNVYSVKKEIGPNMVAVILYYRDSSGIKVSDAWVET